MNNSIYTFTYQITPEKNNLFSFVCLDWNCVYSQGVSIADCKKNAIEVTEMFLKMLKQNELDKTQQPKLKAHKNNPLTFQLSFNAETCKAIHIENLKSISAINKYARVA